MSLEAITVDGKSVVFSLCCGQVGINDNHLTRAEFSQTLKNLWQSYVNSKQDRVTLDKYEFKMFPDFIGITEYFLSNGWGTQAGNLIHPEQEETLYWLKSNVEGKQDSNLQRINTLLDSIVYNLSRNKQEHSLRN